MLVYNDFTSQVTSSEFSGRLYHLLTSSSFLMKSVVSLICEGSSLTKGSSSKSVHLEIFSVIVPLVLCIGLPGGGVFFLCIFGKKYRFPILGLL